MVDVLILNYNDCNTTICAVERLQTYEHIKQILVVDNNSTDDSFRRMKECKINKMLVVKSPQNGGYGAGNNFGIRFLKDKCKSKYVLLCNPDTVVEEHVVSKLELFLKSNLEYAIVAPFMCDKNNKRQINTAFKIPNKAGYIASIEVLLSKFLRPIFYRDIVRTKNGIKDVDGVTGSLLLMDIDKMISCGLYDESIFLYNEEMVIAKKLKTCGYKSALMTDVSFVHNHSVSISKVYASSMKRQKLLVESYLYVAKNYFSAGRLDLIIARILGMLSIVEEVGASLFHRIIR